ncbi:TetR/AcrR family transcriptional regulator [Hyphomonas sp.]|uniref:TetR/AcrR family transcriptional regulator n=1 Tax=Hyphomonas sp. TaxID=87 RepID=UPI003919D355
MVKRTTEQAAETRETILAAARDLFTSTGYASTSVVDIAEKAGHSKGALFHHFEKKEDLFLAVWKTLQIEMDLQARDAAIASRSRTDPYASFLAGCRVYLEWSQRADYQRIVLIDGPAVLGMERWHKLDFELGAENMTRGTDYLARAGRFPLRLSKSAAIMLQAALNGAGFVLSSGSPDITEDEVFETFERLLRGLA